MLKNHWYTACASSQLKGGAPFATQIGDEKIVLFRDSSDTVHALLDRCCHRGLPLSRGKVVGDAIACGFHGWQFDGQGRCVHVPSMIDGQEVPIDFSIPRFHCVDSDGFIWVWIGDLDMKPVPRIAEFEDGKWIQGSRVVHCGYLRALEITFDTSHIPFVHPTHPMTAASKKKGFKLVESEIRMRENGCVAFSPAASDESAPIPTDAWSMEFILPNRVRFEIPSQGNRHEKLYMYYHVVPLSVDSCRVEWLISNSAARAPKHLWVDGGKEIIEEDQAILEASQAVYAREGDAFEKSVEADTSALTLRRIIRAAESFEWSLDKWPYQRRRIVATLAPAP